jgi:predicted nucleic acid-binding protein
VARRLIVDTGILIAAERGRLDLTGILLDDDDAVISAVTLAELLTGVELASDSARSRRRTYVTQLLELLPVEPYGADVAGHHAVLLAEVQRSGRRRGEHDLIVAATARATSRAVLTTDHTARFGELSGVREILLG